MRAELEAAGVGAPLAARLASFGALLLDANRRVNLTGANSVAALLPHLLDSLSVVPYVHGPLVDVGSGGGLPAIPVALATGYPVTLVEATAKKAAFLEHAADRLEIRATIYSERAERVAHETGCRERFACATARAVASAPAVAELTVPFLQLGGRAILQRGPADPGEAAVVADALLVLGGVLEETITLGHGRRLLLVRKQTATPARFPRRPGIPERRPLGGGVSRETSR